MADRKQPRKKSKPKRRYPGGAANIRLTATAAGVIYDGESLDTWDDEELMRGRRRNKHGTFTGRPAQVVPAALLHELNRRRFSRAHALMADSLVDGAVMLRSIINDKKADPSDRIKAAELLFNRVLGKPHESVSLEVAGEGSTVPWQKMMAGAIVASVEEAGLILDRERSLAEQDIVDAQIVMEADDDDE
jgi:hypothetical protein